MHQVKVTDKYRVTIPREIRDLLRIRKGQKVEVTEHSGVITIELNAAASPEKHNSTGQTT